MVVQETPYSMIITSAFTPVACNWCAYTPDSVKGEKLYGVAANDPVRYCSHECLQADNALHALEVKALEALKGYVLCHDSMMSCSCLNSQCSCMNQLSL